MDKKTTAKKARKLLRIDIKEKSINKILMSLLPTKSNKIKAANMAVMMDIEVIYIYDD